MGKEKEFYISPYWDLTHITMRDGNFSTFISKNSDLTIYEGRTAWHLLKAFIAQQLIENGSIRIPGIGLLRILVSYDGKFKFKGEYKPDVSLFPYITKKLLDNMDFSPYILSARKHRVSVPLYDNRELI